MLLALALGSVGTTMQAADAPWAVKAAPYRVLIRVKASPADADTGTEIQVPDLGVVGTAKGGDYALTDAAGTPVPVAAVWQGQGQDTLLLASGLQEGQDYYLYIGGPRGLTWTPKTSLLFETRSLPNGHTAFTSSAGIQDSWKIAPSLGAKFVPEIFSGNNPFGEGSNFLSHFIGYLAPQGGGQELYTTSSDASFVLLDGQPFVEAPGNHPGHGFAKGRAAKEVAGFEGADPGGLLPIEKRRGRPGNVAGMDRRRQAGDDPGELVAASGDERDRALRGRARASRPGDARPV